MHGALKMEQQKKKTVLLYSLQSLHNVHILLILEALGSSWMRNFPQVYEQLLLLWNMLSQRSRLNSAFTKS